MSKLSRVSDFVSDWRGDVWVVKMSVCHCACMVCVYKTYSNSYFDYLNLDLYISNCQFIHINIVSEKI